MNKLVLIGNGFDLAHGLKTRYTDFLLWYLNNTIQDFHKFKEYEDRLVVISFKSFYIDNLSIDCTSINNFKHSLELNKNEIKFNIKSAFLKKLFNITIELNWIEIESVYYDSLKEIYRQREQTPTQPTIYDLKAKQLNDDFDYLKNELRKYLNIVESSKKNQIPDIVEHFKNHFSTVPNTRTRIMFLNFNYTSTIESYLGYINHKQYNVNYIHGKLKDETNPIIFGYGDEIDGYYQKIENINNNEYLKNFRLNGHFGLLFG